MSYNPATDFLGLFRQTGGGVRSADMPGLDWLIAGMARAGIFLLVAHPTTPPASNQSKTVWLKTNATSYGAEGTVWLWNGSAYAVATPALWQALFAASAWGRGYEQFLHHYDPQFEGMAHR